MLWAPGGEVLRETFGECVCVWLTADFQMCAGCGCWKSVLHHRLLLFSFTPPFSLTIPQFILTLFLFSALHLPYLSPVTLYYGCKKILPLNNVPSAMWGKYIIPIYDHHNKSRMKWNNEAAVSQNVKQREVIHFVECWKQLSFNTDIDTHNLYPLTVTCGFFVH